MRGDISTPWAGRAKEYSWSLCLGLAPRKITPTDIDYIIECGKRFALFEMKTQGTAVPHGQRRMLVELLKKLGESAILFIVEHAPLDRVEMPKDVLRFKCVRVDGSGVFRSTKYLDGEHFSKVYEGFFIWAEGGSFKEMQDLIANLN